jgi:hypothetical protein
MTRNLTIDEQLAKRVEKVAERMGMSLDQFVRHCLEEVMPPAQPKRSAKEQIAKLRRLTAEGQGHSGGWKFNREELYDGRG